MTQLISFVTALFSSSTLIKLNAFHHSLLRPPHPTLLFASLSYLVFTLENVCSTLWILIFAFLPWFSVL